MHHDELRREDWNWRYVCDCGYASKIGDRKLLELVQRIHRHRHNVGLAGTYHHPQTGHDT